jgi:hypothetical protein
MNPHEFEDASPRTSNAHERAREKGRERSADRTCPGFPEGDFPKDRDAWREMDRIRLGVRINDTLTAERASFDFLAEHYLKADFGEDAVRPRSVSTIPIAAHYIRE